MRTILKAAIFVSVMVLTPLVFAQDPPAEAPPPPPPPPAPPALKQVQVQVWISETNEEGLRDIGNNLTYTRFVDGEEQSGSVQQVESRLINTDTGENFLGPTVPAPVAPPPNSFGGTLRPDNDNNPATGVPGPSGFGLTYSIVEEDYGALSGRFRAIENKGDVDTISKPEVLVEDKNEATIRAGNQLPYQSVSYPKGQPVLAVAWENTGVNMRITPTIMPNDFVELNIQELDVTDELRPVVSRGIELPVISKRSQTGFVQVPNGETLVIGGLTSRRVTRSEQRVPILGKIPLLGMPFRRRLSEAQVTTLLIFVSPTIVDMRSISEESQGALEFWRERGTDWENKERIEEEIDRMNNEL